MHKLQIGLAALLFCAPLAAAPLTLPTPAFAAERTQVVQGSIDGPDTPIAINTHQGDGRERTDQALALLRDDNSRRRTVGMGPLALDQKLCDVARGHALAMIAGGYFGHDNPQGVGPFERMTAAGVKYGYAGENLAMDKNEAVAEQALYSSPEHRENTLERHYVRVGIVAFATPRGEIFVEDFSD